jgi:hypothetical protein
MLSPALLRNLIELIFESIESVRCGNTIKALNTIEGFWSLVKRGIGGVYHQVFQKYLQSYLDEYTFSV